MACTCDNLAACDDPFWNSISVSPAAYDRHPRARPRIVEGSREDQVQDHGSGKGHPLRACAHAAPLAGNHTTARSGTLWRHTVRLMLARAISVKGINGHVQFRKGGEVSLSSMV